MRKLFFILSFFFCTSNGVVSVYGMQGKVLDTPLRTFCMVGLGVCGIFSQREAWAEGSYVGAVGSEGYECGRSIAFREDGTSFIAGVANSSTGYNSLLFSFDQNNQTLGGISFGEIKEGDQGPFRVPLEVPPGVKN